MLSHEAGDELEREPKSEHNQNTIVLDHIPEEPVIELPLHYKKKNKNISSSVSKDNNSSPSPSTPHTSSPPPPPPLPAELKPSRRGLNSRPGIKTALPPTKIESSLLTLSESTIITSSELLVLVGWMPKHQRINEFHLSYVLKRDGASLETVYSICSDPDISASFIIIEAEDGHVFGGFINEPFKKSSTYYGTGESFVFSIRPELAVYRWQSGHSFEDGMRQSDNTEKESVPDLGLFVLSDTTQLLMGSGGGFAFRVDDELHLGCSQPCATYQNKLLSQSEFFKVVNVEIWNTKPAPVMIPLPPKPSLTPIAKPSPHEEEVILKKKSTTNKSRVLNPSSLSFSTTAPIKKGGSNALNEWKTDAATIVQSTWRGFVCRRPFVKVKLGTLLMQRVWRGHNIRRKHSYAYRNVVSHRPVAVAVQSPMSSTRVDSPPSVQTCQRVKLAVQQQQEELQVEQQSTSQLEASGRRRKKKKGEPGQPRPVGEDATNPDTVENKSKNKTKTQSIPSPTSASGSVPPPSDEHNSMKQATHPSDEYLQGKPSPSNGDDLNIASKPLTNTHKNDVDGREPSLSPLQGGGTSSVVLVPLLLLLACIVLVIAAYYGAK